MTSNTNTHVLDNLCWYALNSYHARFATGTSLVKRYPEDIFGLPALIDHSEAALHDLAQLVPPGEQVPLFEAYPPAEIPGWTMHEVIKFPQMVSEKPLPPVETTVQIVNLRAADVDDMIALVELTKPGIRSLDELGDFIGIRQNGQLAAMAGTRFHLTGYQEISGVCTHPEHQRKGYARLLVSTLVNAVWERGETPFLHVDPTHTHAVHLYEDLHFHERCYVQVVIMSH